MFKKTARNVKFGSYQNKKNGTGLKHDEIKYDNSQMKLCLYVFSHFYLFTLYSFHAVDQTGYLAVFKCTLNICSFNSS